MAQNFPSSFTPDAPVSASPKLPSSFLADSDTLPAAIAKAEGAHPDDHNPGNLSIGVANQVGISPSGSRQSTGTGATSIAQFPDDETGHQALSKYLAGFPPNTTYKDLADKYAPGQPEWLNNVTRIMKAKPTDFIGMPSAPRPTIPAGPVGGGSTISARTPSLMERATSVFLSGIPRYSSQTPTSPTYGQSQLITPQAAMTPKEQVQHPIATGLGEVGGGLTSPENAAILAASGGLGELPGAAGKLIPRVVGGGFGAQALYQSASDAVEAARQYERGAVSEAERMGTHAVANLVLGGLALKHAMTGDIKASPVKPQPQSTVDTTGPREVTPTPPPTAPDVQGLASTVKTAPPAAADVKQPVTEPVIAGPQLSLFGGEERRVNSAERQRVANMSPEEMQRELLTSKTTGLPNRRAFDETADRGAVAMSDADGLKALNDKYGYEAGNALLRAKAESLREAGLEAYHDKGDEFLYKGASKEELQSKLADARDILRNKTIQVPNGPQFKGADFSFGVGGDEASAEAGLKAHKAAREAAGERARGELRGITEIGQKPPVPEGYKEVPPPPDAVKAKPGPKADMGVAGVPLSQQLADLEKSAARLRRPDLLENQRAYIAAGHDTALTTAARTISESGNPDVALGLFGTRSAELGNQIDYLQRHLKDRDKILETERAAADVTRTGQDIARNKAVTGVPLHPERDPYGNMLVDEAGNLTMREGAPRAMRDAVGALLGKRGVEVLDKQATPEGPVPEHIQRAMDERDELKEAISSGAIGPENFGDASDSLKTLENIISEYRRTATKQSFRPTKAQVAEAKGVPVSEVTTTGAGEAADIYHKGLPVITRKIWEDTYGGGKGKSLPTAEQIQNKLTRLQAQKEILDTVTERANKFRDRGEAGVAPLRVAGGMAAGGLVGAAVHGPVGAAIGAALGGVASAIDIPLVAARLSVELGDLRNRFGYSLEQARDSYRDWLAPVSKDPAVSDVMFNRNAEIARSDAHARDAFSSYRLAGYSLPRDMQVKFVDLVKAGDHVGIEKAFGPEWRQYAEDRLIKEEDNYKRMQAAVDELSRAKGGGPANMLPYLENHDRVMWKTLPGGADWIAHNLSRKLEGTKGMLKQHTLADMSTGVATGGVPYSWNPVENDLLAWHDTERFIQTTKAVAQFIEQHKSDPLIPGAEFVKLGEKAPDGYTKVAGTKSEVYFPAQSGEGLVKAGEWYMHKDIARMIDNVTSPDYIRGNVLGRTWLGWRRTIGTGRLFGPFHAFLMNTTAMGYKAGMGIREAANLGIGNADIGHIMSGLRDLATSPVSGVSEFKIGQAAREGEFDPRFWNTAEGAKLKQLYPGVENYIDLLWQGGGKNLFRVDEDMRLRYNEGLKQHAIEAADKFSKGKYIQAGYEASATAGNALLSPIQLAMKPLFETYIPSLKLGHALNDLDLSLQERATDIANGKTTEATVARDVVRRVEGYFGEMNTDNLFLKNTFRTALTAYYRSFSFRFGTVDRAWAAVRGQATNAIEAAKGNTRLQLNPDVAVWGGMLIHAAIGSAILMKLMAHKNPSSLTDVMHPQMGELDDRGKPIRADWPSYISGPASQMKENYGLGTLQYATGGQSDFLQYMREALSNRKFDGGYVADPAEYSKMGQLFYRFSHAVVPIGPGGKYPFVIENTQRWAQSGMPLGKAAAAVALGMSPTRRAEGLSDAESLALELGSASSHTPVYSDTDQKRYQATRELTAALRNKRTDVGQLAGQMLKDNQIQPSDLAKAFTNSNIPYLQYEVEGDRYKKGLNFQDTYAVMKVATPEERNQLLPYFIKQYAQTIAKDPKNQSSYTSKFQEVMPHRTTPNVGQPVKVPTSFKANLPIGESMNDADTRFQVAQHEAAHAVVAESQQPGSVENMALTGRGGITNVSSPGGITDARQLSRDQLIGNVAVSLAGGLGEPGGTSQLHASGDNAERHQLLGGLASTPISNVSRLLTGKVFGGDPMLDAPNIQAAAQARANLTLSDPSMRQAMQNLAGQLNQNVKLTGDQVRATLKNGR